MFSRAKFNCRSVFFLFGLFIAVGEAAAAVCKHEGKGRLAVLKRGYKYVCKVWDWKMIAQKMCGGFFLKIEGRGCAFR